MKPVRSPLVKASGKVLTGVTDFDEATGCGAANAGELRGADAAKPGRNGSAP